MRFSLDGRVLTCAASTCAQPDLRNGQRRADQRDLRRERRRAGGWARDHAHPAWPAGQTSLSYRFPRDVSSWCRLYDQSGSNVASVSFLGASPGPTGPIADRRQVGAAVGLQL